MRDRYKFHIMNHIIYNIYNFNHFEEMQLQLLEDLHAIVPNCYASLFIANPETGQLEENPISYSAQGMKINDECSTYVNRDHLKWIPRKRNPLIIRLSDLTDDEAFDAFYVVYVTIATRDYGLGLLVLYRKKEDGDFGEEDVFWLQMLNEHLNPRFYRELKLEEKTGDKAPETYVWTKTYGLTQKETEVAERILRQLPDDMVCDELNISKNTLKKHRANIYHKTGVNGKKALLELLTDYK